MAVTQTYCDYGTGNDYNGASFVDGAFTVADMTLTKAGAFTKSKTNHWLYLTDNGSGNVTPGYYKIASVTSVNAVVLATSPKSGATDPTDVKCTQATGTALLPFRSIQGALDIITQDATNGDQINVKSSTTQTLSATLVLTTYGTPTATARLWIRGYTTSANDGGIATIDGAGSYAIYATATNFFNFFDLHLTNTGANTILTVGQQCIIHRCEVDTNSRGGVYTGGASIISGCYGHGWGTSATYYCFYVGGAGAIIGNYVDCTGCSSSNIGIGTNAASLIYSNVVKAVLCTGILSAGATSHIIGNTLFGAASTKPGISLTTTDTGVMMNNYIEGFSGVGGIGFSASTNRILVYGSNAFYNNATPFSGTGLISLELGNNDTAAASALVDPGGGNFAINGSVAGVSEDAFPLTYNGSVTTNKADKGAVQSGAGTGGAVSISPSLGSVGAA